MKKDNGPSQASSMVNRDQPAPRPREWWLTGQYDNPMFALTQKPADDSVHVIEATPTNLAAEQMALAIEDALEQFNDRECNCDGEYVDGRVVGHACYFHRIEQDLRDALKKARGGRLSKKREEAKVCSHGTWLKNVLTGLWQCANCGDQRKRLPKARGGQK